MWASPAATTHVAISKMTRPANTSKKVSAAEAVAALDAVNASPTILNVTSAASQLSRFRPALGRSAARIACLASFTFEPIKPALEVQCLRAGLAIDTYFAPFGQFEQELISPASGLGRFEPQVVLLAARLADVCPAIYEEFTGLEPGDAERMLDDWHARLAAGLRAFRGRSEAYVFVQNYELPVSLALGIADAAAELSQAGFIRLANDRLAELAAGFQNVMVMDYDGLVARHGRRTWADARLKFYARIPVAAEHYWNLAGFYVRHLRPFFGLTRKVLVLDADHTLWGGVVGDVGLDGIDLGHDFPGNAYVAFQKRVLDLHRCGIVLAIASKNEPGGVQEVLERHPAMVLRAEHFAALEVNWSPKPQSVRRIAERLNLGLDSFVFIDDSPTECELMRASLPEVMTVLLPKDPAAYAAVIEDLDCFDQWSISAEDRQRGALYHAEARRRELQEAVVDLPTFYRSLGMRMTVYVDHAPHAARAAQMTNRTNQFNMHTIRCTEDDIRRFIQSAESELVTLELADRFGDNGVVGLAVVRKAAAAWTLHLLLMSCRILGRTVEQAFVRWLADRARAAGAVRLRAEFAATKKNKPFAGFYADSGFECSGASGDTEAWELDLSGPLEPPPDWINLTVQEAPPKR